jgi:hypothetical protein
MRAAQPGRRPGGARSLSSRSRAAVHAIPGGLPGPRQPPPTTAQTEVDVLADLVDLVALDGRDCVVGVECSTYRSATPSGWPRPARSPRWVPAATPTTTRWPRRSSACTRPSWSPARLLEGHRPGRVRHPGVGRLVQPPPAAGADRPRPTGRVRGRLLEKGDPRHHRRTQEPKPPVNPGRFSRRRGWGCWCRSSWGRWWR